MPDSITSKADNPPATGGSVGNVVEIDGW